MTRKSRIRYEYGQIDKRCANIDVFSQILKSYRRKENAINTAYGIEYHRPGLRLRLEPRFCQNEKHILRLRFD